MTIEAPTVDVHDATASADLEVAFRLPITGWPRALFRTNFGYDGGTLVVDGQRALVATSHQALQRGVACTLADDTRVQVQLVKRDGDDVLVVHAGDREAPRERDVHAPPSRSAWIHGCIGLGASLFGFLAGYLYLQKAGAVQSPWAMKMGYHTAAWHALLTVGLFPASVWGQRLGIRAVQLVSALFFCIHLGIAIANAFWPDAGSNSDAYIALLNALSGAGFLASVLYGNRAHRDMDPVAALRSGRALI
jgi:hypothetical protein